MKPVADDMALLIEEGSLGTRKATSGWGIYIEFMPAQPATVISVFDTPSPPPTTPMAGRTIVDAATKPLSFCNFQVQVRGTDFLTCFRKIKEVAGYLNGLHHFRVTDTPEPDVLYASIVQTTDFLPLASGEKQVYIRSVNFRAARRELSYQD